MFNVILRNVFRLGNRGNIGSSLAKRTKVETAL